MNYKDYYKDPRWQKKRLEIMKQAKFMCEECQTKTKTLHIHHNFYKKGAKPWEYDNNDLSCLCEECHKEITDLDNIIQKKIGSFNTELKYKILGYIEANILGDCYPFAKLTTMNPFYAEGISDYYRMSYKKILTLWDRIGLEKINDDEILKIKARQNLIYEK